MAPSIPSPILIEYVGVEAGTAKYKEVYDAVHDLLVEFPRRKAIFDSRPSVQMQKLQRLRKAVQGLAEADAALDAGDRDTLAGVREEGACLVDTHPDLDVRPLVARMNAALDEALAKLAHDIKWAEYNGEKGGRRTESARDDTVRELARLFHWCYKLHDSDYKDNLVDFLKKLLDANKIPCPKHEQSILGLLPQELKKPRV
jgi:hypothetical protein